MIDGPLAQPGYAARARAAFAAGADSAIGDHTAGTNGQHVVVTAHADRDDLDNVEHVRKDRLRRWQTPPLPTRTAKECI